MSMHLESIQRFYPDATEAQVESIVKHLGIAMQSQDGQTVAASDQKELDQIRDGFCAKKLSLSTEEAESKIAEVIEDMKHDTAKCRVTFYYLLAAKTDQLAQFS